MLLAWSLSYESPYLSRLTDVAVAAGLEVLVMLVDFAVADAGLLDVMLVLRPRFRARLALVAVARITLAWCLRAPSAKTARQSGVSATATKVSGNCPHRALRVRPA